MLKRQFIQVYYFLGGLKQQILVALSLKSVSLGQIQGDFMVGHPPKAVRENLFQLLLASGGCQNFFACGRIIALS